MKPIAQIAAGLALAGIAQLATASATHGAERSITVEIAGPTCGESFYSVELPPRAANVRATPSHNAELTDGARNSVAYVWHISGDFAGSRRVQWNVDFDCDPHAEALVPWSQTFTARYRVLPFRATLHRAQAQAHARSAMARRFGAAYSHGYSKVADCTRRLSKNIRRCRVEWFIGDGIYTGTVRVALFRQGDTSLYARVRYRIELIDDLCRHLGNPDCTRVYSGRLRIDADE